MTPGQTFPPRKSSATAIPGKADQEERVTDTEYDWDLRKPIKTDR